MARRWIPLYVTLLAASLNPAAAQADVTTERPRIYLTQAALPGLQAELPADPDFILMQKWMDRRIMYQDAGPMLTGNYPNIIMTEAAFVAAMLPAAPAYADEARGYLATLAAIAPDPDGNLTATRNRLLALAIGHDWLHGALTPGERTTVRDAIVAHGMGLDPLLSDPNFVSGPSRWANVVALAGAVSIAGDDDRLDATLAAVLTNWRDGYNPALELIGAGGGHHMAWMYGPAYSGYEAPLLWRTASTVPEPWVPDFLADAAYFPLYAANGAYQVPPIEDCFGNTIATGALGQIALSAGLFGNGHAEAFYRELDAAFEDPPLLQPPDLWLRLVTRGGAPEPAPIEALPRTRLFPGSGFLVSRDTWSRADATTIVFKASPFYSIGHHQRDEGSLYIDYRGPLLVDAGQYDGSGVNDHYRNFYARSVAHNTLLVHWPEEDVPLAGFLADGGQEVRVSQGEDAEQIAGEFALTGIVGHSDADACVWARSDTADTYRSEKLTTYTRDVLTVRRPGQAAHPAVFVLDRATLPEPRKSSVLWHFAADAVVDVENRRIQAEGADQSDVHPALSGGRIRLDLLRPASPQIDPFTGADRWTVNGAAHPPLPAEDLLSPYWGRVEVSVEELAPVWSTLIRVGDAELADDTLAPTDVGGADWIGARLGDTLFAIASPSTTTLELPAAAPLVDGCIAGLAPDKLVSVVVGDGPPVQIQANADGVAVYDPSGIDDPSTTSTTGDDPTSAGDDETAGPGDDGPASTDETGAATPTTTAPPGTTSGVTTGDTTGAADETPSDGGCGCVTTPPAPTLAALLPTLALLPRRRRARPSPA